MDTTPRPAEVELSALADVVWAERAALEQLAFKLVALKLVLGADLRRFVGRCLDEVDSAWEVLTRIEDRRLAHLAALCAAWDRPEGSLDLTSLAAEAPEPWATVFADHRDHLRGLAAEVDHASAESARLCAATLGQLDDDLASVGVATRRALREHTAPAPTPLRLVGSRPPDPRSAPQGSLA